MADTSFFKRVEKKYFMTDAQREKFLELTEPYMKEDEYGLTKILNIYFDTENYDLIRRSLEKPEYKEKLRLRTYGVPDKKSKAFVEIKKKFDGVVYKRRETLKLAEAADFLLEGKEPCKKSQILNEIRYFKDFYKVVPKLFIAYDRRAYFGKQDPSLRMTIDQNLRYRIRDLDLTKGDYGTAYFNQDTFLLEIKVNEAFPLWMSEALNECGIYPVSFSKYGAIYTSLQKGIWQDEFKKRKAGSERKETLQCLTA